MNEIDSQNNIQEQAENTIFHSIWDSLRNIRFLPEQIEKISEQLEFEIDVKILEHMEQSFFQTSIPLSNASISIHNKLILKDESIPNLRKPAD